MTRQRRVQRPHGVMTTNEQTPAEPFAPPDARRSPGTAGAPDEMVPGAWETDGGRVSAPRRAWDPPALP